ncbi:hypothetical protein BHE74_00038453, partial [Ensete ventricosum]
MRNTRYRAVPPVLCIPFDTGYRTIPSRARYAAVRPRTTRYIPVRQSISAVGRYRVVPLKSVIGDQFRLSAIDFTCRRSIDGEIDRWRSIEEEKGKKKRRGKEERSTWPPSSPALPARPCRPRVARETSRPLQPASDYPPRTGRENEA